MKNLQKYLFYLILIVFPFGQLLRVNLSSFIPGLRVHLLDIVVFTFSSCWILKKLFKKGKWILPFFSRGLLVFCLIATLSLFLQMGRLKLAELLGALFYLLRLLNFVAFFFALTDFFKTEKLKVYHYLVGEGIIIAFFSLFQYLIIPDTRFLFNFGWDEHYFRAIGSFLDPAFAGLLLVLSFVIWWIEFVEGERYKKFFWWLAGLLLLTSLGLTFSRIAYFSLLSGMGAILLVKRRFLLFLGIALILFSIIVILPKPGGEGVNLLRVSSFVARADNCRQTWSIVKDHFWFGVGFNTLRYTQRDYQFLSSADWQETNAGAGADNSFLFILATTGFFGFLAFLYFWFELLYLSFVFLNKVSSLGLLGSLVALTVSSMVVNGLFYLWVMVWLAILLANFTVDNLSSIEARSCFGRGQDR